MTVALPVKMDDGRIELQLLWHQHPGWRRRHPLRALHRLCCPTIAPSAQFLHAHDGHAALAPAYLRTAFSGQPYSDRLATVLSVHNAGFQGYFPADTITDIGLPAELCDPRGFDRYGQTNLLKGGIGFSDAVVRGSPTHARELRSIDGGFGLHETFARWGTDSPEF